nr:MAG TPA: hypothetical protein [Caudoviricetes sp.]
MRNTLYFIVKIFINMVRSIYMNSNRSRIINSLNIP